MRTANADISSEVEGQGRMKRWLSGGDVIVPTALSGGLMSSLAITLIADSANTSSQFGEIITLVGAVGGLIASVAALVAALRRRESSSVNIIVRSEGEAKQLTEKIVQGGGRVNRRRRPAKHTSVRNKIERQ